MCCASSSGGEPGECAFGCKAMLGRQAVGQDGGATVDAVDAEAVLLLKWGSLAGDSLDKVGQTFGLLVIVGEGEDVDLDRHGGLGGELVLRVGAEDGLGADHDHGRPLNDLAGRTDCMLELVASH